VLYYERKLKKQGFDFIVGVDEAGRGPLAGPVVAAAVALKTSRFQNRIDDSKKLSPLARENALCEILEKSSFGIGIISEQIIDRINILEATRLAMRDALQSLLRKSGPLKERNIHIIVDGNMKLEAGFPCLSLIKADSRSLSVAAASILAKVTRDRLMGFYHRLWPQYDFQRHKGYPTREHRRLIARRGPSAAHRLTFL
jgi:ribonuclease HII